MAELVNVNTADFGTKFRTIPELVNFYRRECKLYLPQPRYCTWMWLRQI